MATHKSAEKRARQSERRRLRNRQIRSRIKTLVGDVRESAAAGRLDEAGEKLRSAESALAKAVSKSVVPKKRASRRISRLAKSLHRQSASK